MTILVIINLLFFIIRSDSNPLSRPPPNGTYQFILLKDMKDWFNTNKIRSTDSVERERERERHPSEITQDSRTASRDQCPLFARILRRFGRVSEIDQTAHPTEASTGETGNSSRRGNGMTWPGEFAWNTWTLAYTRRWLQSRSPLSMWPEPEASAACRRRSFPRWLGNKHSQHHKHSHWGI